MKEPPLETEEDIRTNMALALRMGWRVHTGAKEAVGLLEDPPDDVVWPDED